VPGTSARHAAPRSKDRPLGLWQALRAEPTPGVAFRLADLGTKVLTTYALGGVAALTALRASPDGPRFFPQAAAALVLAGWALLAVVGHVQRRVRRQLARRRPDLAEALARRPRPGSGWAAIPYLLFLLACVILVPLALDVGDLTTDDGGAGVLAYGLLLVSGGFSNWYQRSVRGPYQALLLAAMDDEAGHEQDRAWYRPSPPGVKGKP